MAQSFSIKIAVLLTCHNRKQKTLECLNALRRQKLPDSAQIVIYLVDDGSSDGTVEAIRDLYPQINLLLGDGTLYWGGGMRLAFSEAMKTEHDFYLWLNDDVLLAESAIKEMLTTYQEIKVRGSLKSIIVGSTKDPQTGTVSYGGFRKGTWFRPLWFSRVLPGTTPSACDTMNGNCVLIPEIVARTVGNIDSSFTHAMGDLDYGLRACSNGCQVWLAPGHVGTCGYNPPEGTWKDQKLPLLVRFKKVRQFKGGLPFREWKLFVHRHGGALWFFYWLFSYRRLIGLP